MCRMPKHRVRRVLTLSVLAVCSVALLGAGSPARSTKTVSPKKYARSVCTGVGTWVQTLQDGSTRIQADLSPAALGTLADTKTILDRAKTSVGSFMESAVAGTDTLLNRLARAGTPDTPKGKKVAKKLVAGFRGIRSLLDDARHAAQALPDNDAQAFTDGAQKVSGSITKGFDDFSAAFKSLDKLDPNHKLRKAFRAEPACRALSQ